MTMTQRGKLCEESDFHMSRMSRASRSSMMSMDSMYTDMSINKSANFLGFDCLEYVRVERVNKNELITFRGN